MKLKNFLKLGLALLVGILLVLGFINASPESVARQRAIEAGWNDEDLSWTHKSWSNWPILKQGEVVFRVPRKDPSIAIHVEVWQPVFFLGWQVVNYREQKKTSE